MVHVFKAPFRLSSVLACLVYLENTTPILASFQPQVYISLHERRSVSTGGCPEMYLDSEAACAMQCYLHHWCRVYVIGPCDQETKNPCLCVICQMDPIIHTYMGGERSSRKLSLPKRLEDDSRCGSGLKWTSVHSNCLNSIHAVQSNTGVSPILSLKLVSHATIQSTGRTKVTASPMCPPNFSPRGLVTCYADEGVWHDQTSLVCYSLHCYQDKGDNLLYAGDLSVSRNGRPCWPWRDQGPMENKFLHYPFLFDYYSVAKANNYCRSFPSDKHKAIWCYNANYNSASDSVRWEECQVPQCQSIY